MTAAPTAPNANAINANAIKAVQTCRRQVAGLGDDAPWRAFLVLVTGKNSLRAMDGPELGRVIDALRQRGAKTWRGGRPPGGGISPHPHVRKVWALWADLCRAGIPDAPTRDGLAAFVRRQVQVDSPDWLTAEQSAAVIEGLKAWRRRGRRAREAGQGGGRG